MKQIFYAVREIKDEIVKEKGEVHLFGLFLRAKGVGKWDLVVAADWIDADWFDALDYISVKAQNSLSLEEIKKIARVVPLKKDAPGLADLLAEVSTLDGEVDFYNRPFFNMDMDRVHLFRASRELESAGTE